MIESHESKSRFVVTTSHDTSRSKSAENIVIFTIAECTAKSLKELNIPAKILLSPKHNSVLCSSFNTAIAFPHHTVLLSFVSVFILSCVSHCCVFAIDLVLCIVLPYHCVVPRAWRNLVHKLYRGITIKNPLDFGPRTFLSPQYKNSGKQNLIDDRW